MSLKQSTSSTKDEGAQQVPEWSLFANLKNEYDQRNPVTGDSSLIPPSFHGLQTENAAEWAQYFSNYITIVLTSS